MPLRFIHTADLHFGKTYRHSPGAAERGEDFFQVGTEIVAAAVREEVDAVLIAGDLFHTGQILPRTFARTIEVLQPLKEAGIPCVAVEGNHDWIHRRDRLSWMEALSAMGYLRLLRPERTAEGDYHFPPFDGEEGRGGHLEIGGRHLYGLGYIGAQAGSHVPRLCEAVATEGNLLLFHVGIWTYSPVEIGNMQPAEAAPLAEVFDYVALGHGHKPYQVPTGGRDFAFNPGAPECVNFGEQRYDKGYYLVSLEDDGTVHREFRPTRPRPMLSAVIDLEGAADAETALRRFREQAAAQLDGGDGRRPLVDLKLTGRVAFHPFELGRERLLAAVAEVAAPLHVEIRNHLSLLVRETAGAGSGRGLAEIEREVLAELAGAGNAWQGREEELVRLALTIRDRVLQGEADGEELLGLLDAVGESASRPED